jgi:TrmH family RNA methyltransferase
MKRITSRQNAVLAQYRHVARGDDRTMMLLDGPHLINDALAAGLTLRHAMVTDPALDRSEIAILVEQLNQQRVDLTTATDPVMSAASPVRSPSGIVALADRPASGAGRAYAEHPALVVIACGLQDPGNVGAIIRVAEAAGASGFVAAGACADPFGWKALRGSMGSALRLAIHVEPHPEDAVAEARRHRCQVAAAVPRGGSELYEADLRPPLVLLIGAEGPGLPASLLTTADLHLTVPMQPPVESMNAAITAALIVYEARRQRASV